MNWYLAVKVLHIVSATVLFGTGLGTAFFMHRAYRSGNIEAFRVTAEHVVLADWIFTTPAVIVQLLTGLWLTAWINIPFNSLWFVTVVSLYAVVGACWLPVVRIQIRIRGCLRQQASANQCRSLMRRWTALGIPAFLTVLVLFVLMVYRPWVDSPIGI